MRVAWLVSDIFGWRAALSVFPPMLNGKVAIVTGANSGLGLETTKALLQQGATVVMACRSMEHARTSREDILRDPRNAGPIGDAARRLIPLRLDLEDFPSVQAFVRDFHALHLPLHLLVNNAGIHLKPHQHVSCGFERTLATDYFGPFWLSQMLMEDLKANAPARIVNVASVAELLGLFALYTATIPWGDLRGRQLRDSGERPYVMAKTFLLMATREMARRLEGTGVEVVAVHPGIADSSWYLKSDNEAYLFSKIIHRMRSIVGGWLGVGQPVGSGAISTIYACIAPELTGATSSKHSKGLFDGIARALFGGRLRYYGPSYFFNLFIANWNNAGRAYPINPWCYNKAACERLYDATCRLIEQVEHELAQQQQQQQQQQPQGTEAVKAPALTASAREANGTKQPAAVAEPAGQPIAA